MPTKEELASDAIGKAQKLEVEFAGQQKELAHLQSQVTELKVSERDFRELLHSLRTVRWIVQFLLCPVAILLVPLSIYGLIWSSRLGQRVEIIEQRLQKTEDRLEATRDRIITREEELHAKFVKVQGDRILVKVLDKLTDLRLAPDVTVYLGGEQARLEDLKEGMDLQLRIGKSIDNKVFVRAIQERFPQMPLIEENPKKKES